MLLRPAREENQRKDTKVKRLIKCARLDYFIIILVDPPCTSNNVSKPNLCL